MSNHITNHTAVFARIGNDIRRCRLRGLTAHLWASAVNNANDTVNVEHAAPADQYKRIAVETLVGCLSDIKGYAHGFTARDIARTVDWFAARGVRA